jgi:hypothetical protein
MEVPYSRSCQMSFDGFSQQYPRIQVHTDLIDNSEVFLALRGVATLSA